MHIGIVGAGMIGSTLAKLWVDAGHEVRLSSRHPEDLQALVKGLGKGTSAGTPAEAAEFGEVVMLTVPLASVPDLARDFASCSQPKSYSTPEMPTRSATGRRHAGPLSIGKVRPLGRP